MNPWKTLNIQPTDDKKIIKKAYAVLIKQYKPDEQPEKFKEIQEAYKMALSSMRQWQNEDKFDEPLQETVSENQPQNDDFILETAPQLDAESITEQKQQDELIENLYQQLHQMAFAPLAVKDKLENWKFIEKFYQIDDFVLKAEVAKTVFKKVAEYNLFQMKQNNTLLINERCLIFMDEIFAWSSSWKEYEKYFPIQYFNYTIHYKKDESRFQNGLNKIGYVIHRGFAFFIDLMIITILSIFLPEYKTGPFQMLFSFTFIFIFVRFSVEIMTTSRFSLGKYFTNLMVIDAFGNTCSRYKLVKRHLIFNMIFAPIFYIDKTNNDWQGYYLFVFILINIITSLLNLGMLHDFLSKTKVVYRR